MKPRYAFVAMLFTAILIFEMAVLVYLSPIYTPPPRPTPPSAQWATYVDIELRHEETAQWISLHSRLCPKGTVFAGGWVWSSYVIEAGCWSPQEFLRALRRAPNEGGVIIGMDPLKGDAEKTPQ